jgi:branched-chain amino acid transport system ATP-binding protein
VTPLITSPLSVTADHRPLLEGRDIGISFGGLRALDQVSFAARSCEVFSIIGPNGAGKTTLFNIVSGVYRPTNGSVLLDGQDVTNLPPVQLARRGLSRTFQNLQIFFRMTVIENVTVGLHVSERASLFADLLGLPKVRRQNAESHRQAMELLGRVGLQQKASMPAASLAYGELKRLEIARALATKPRVLLLDEPAAGCNATETAEIEALIRKVAADGVAVVLVEHDMRLVMNVSDRILVLDQGRWLSEGTPDVVRHDPKVIAAYLGKHGSKQGANPGAQDSPNQDGLNEEQAHVAG